MTESWLYYLLDPTVIKVSPIRRPCTESRSLQCHWCLWSFDSKIRSGLEYPAMHSSYSANSLQNKSESCERCRIPWGGWRWCYRTAQITHTETLMGEALINSWEDRRTWELLRWAAQRNAWCGIEALRRPREPSPAFVNWWENNACVFWAERQSC